MTDHVPNRTPRGFHPLFRNTRSTNAVGAAVRCATATVARRQPDWLFRRFVVSAALICALLMMAGGAYQNVHGQDLTQSSKANPTKSLADQVVVGIKGHYRVGRTTAVGIYNAAAVESSLGGLNLDELQIETLDGDGVRVRYGASARLQSTVSDVRELGLRELGYVVPGSEAAPLAILRQANPGSEVRDSEIPGNEVLLQTRFPLQGVPSRGPAMIPPQMPWVVAIGDPLGVDEIGVSNVLANKAGRIAVTQVDVASDLPSDARGFDGVDLVMINASGLPVLQGMGDDQHDALATWLRQGGRVFVCLGESTEQVNEAAPWLIEMLKLESVTIARYDPAALETFTSSQTPLPIFRGIKLPRSSGQTLVSGRTTRRVTAILVADYVIGFGRMTVVAADLDRAEFAQWPERMELVTRTIGKLIEDPSLQRDRPDGNTAFGDIAGQLRGVLDQFSIKPSFSFSFVSVIVMLLIAAIGPLDYLLVNRVLGKPLLGWLTFPVVAIALSIFLVVQASPRIETNSISGSTNETVSGLRANQFQVTDIDLVDGTGRGFTWTYLYSHEPTHVNIQYAPSATFESITALDAQRPRSFLFPMGYPGKSFGGIQLADENSVLSPYSIEPRLLGDSGRQGIETLCSGLTLAPRSSKSLANKTSFVPNSEMVTRVARRPGSELLRGEFLNPLPMDLLDGMLVYGNWVYLLPTRVPAGATVESLGNLRQKNLRLRLTREQSSQLSGAEMTPWSPADFSDLKRVSDMIMFYEAAGGELYTRLRHRAIGELDLSDVLVSDRCLLVARTEDPLFNLQVSEVTDELEDGTTPSGSVLSMVRVILPVYSTRLN